MRALVKKAATGQPGRLGWVAMIEAAARLA